MRPRPTLRLRLALWYAATLLVSGAALLGVAYVVVSHSTETYDAEVAAQLQRASAAQAARDVKAGRPPLPFQPPRAVSREERAARRQAEASARRHQRRTIASDFLVALGGLAVVSGLFGWLVAGRALRPLARMTGTAKRVTEHGLGERIGLEGPRDELRELAETLDRMLGRLEAAFASRQRFIANASHELRTPLAVMRAELETTLVDPAADAEDLRRMGLVIERAVARTEALMASLLGLARSEAPLERALPIDLGELGEAVLDGLHGEIAAHDLRLETQLEAVCVSGDPALLEGVILNLVENAVRYNRDAGLLRIRTTAEGGSGSLVVENDGELLTAGQVESLFEPFRRLDGSRSRSTEGAGLGLSIAKAATEAHGGEIEAHARPSGGLAVVVRLPTIERPAQVEPRVHAGTTSARCS
jgi:signal transduction histidine kinase